MCRIAGIINDKLPLTAVEEQVAGMCNLQKHGGPDDAGMYSCPDTSLVLGHRRLALIDLSPLGHQPMFYQQRFVISFNGEIYNFQELKSELIQLGKVFYTHSDTEVILAAFAQWNTQSFAKLKGMFAFALYDKIEKALYLVRDPSGIKPLYYSLSDGTLEFASEIRALQALPNKKLNTKWPVFQLAYGHIPEPVTTLQNVQPLHKGCFLKYNLAGHSSSLQSFTHYSYSSKINEADTAIDGIKKNIRDAVSRHLISDAPIGVFLSGGIDSGIITGIAAEYQQQHLKTLSLYFKETAFSEKAYQDILIKKLQCRHYQHLLSEDEFQQSFPAILNAMDMPSCDGVNTWFISKYAAKQGLKAVLSGIGGDELFGGYPSFGRIRAANILQAMPNSFLGSGKNSGIKSVNRLQYLQLAGVNGLYLFLRGQFIPVQIARQLGATEKEVWNILVEQDAYPPLSRLQTKNQASWMELNMYMQNQLLRDADVMSMAHGVEIRVPFLDDAVLKNTLSIVPRIKYSGMLPKQVLINAFKEVLPEEIWKRKKMGFTFPFTEWLSNSVFVKDLMAGSNEITKQNYALFLTGKLHWSHLMSLILLKSRGVA